MAARRIRGPWCRCSLQLCPAAAAVVAVVRSTAAGEAGAAVEEAVKVMAGRTIDHAGATELSMTALSAALRH